MRDYRIKPATNKESYYDIPDLDHLKRVLLNRKTAVFDDLGKFSLYDNRIRFDADINLRNQIWNWGYHNMQIEEDKRTKIIDDLVSGKKIVLDGFGYVYIWFQQAYEKFHHWHGTEFVPPKPFLRFQVDLDFIENISA